MFAESFFDEMEKIAVGWGGPVSGMIGRADALHPMPPGDIQSFRSYYAKKMQSARRRNPAFAKTQFREMKAERPTISTHHLGVNAKKNYGTLRFAPDSQIPRMAPGQLDYPTNA